MAGEEFVAQREAEGRGRFDTFTSPAGVSTYAACLNPLTTTSPSVLRLTTLFYS